MAKTLSEILDSAGIHHEPSKIEGKRDWFDAYDELIGTFDAHDGWNEVRKFLVDRADADHDGEGFVPNREMRILTDFDFAAQFSR